MCCHPSTKLGRKWEESLLCRERWCQHINVHGFFFRCIFPRQCTLKLITLTLRRAVSIPIPPTPCSHQRATRGQKAAVHTRHSSRFSKQQLTDPVYGPHRGGASNCSLAELRKELRADHKEQGKAEHKCQGLYQWLCDLRAPTTVSFRKGQSGKS